MKYTIKKAVCLILTVAVTLLSTAFVFAAHDNEAHIHSENCIYSCELDVIAPIANKTPTHPHIDHEGSENCKYSCEHDFNSHVSTSSKNVWSQETLQSYLEDAEKVSSKEEFISMMAKYYNMSEEEFRQVVMEIETNPSDKPSINILDNELIQSAVILNDQFHSSSNTEAIAATVSELDLCNHMLYAGFCVENHYGYNEEDCTIWCRRECQCSQCFQTFELVVQEDCHDWSVGWCGQTCKVCKTVEMFHEEGGCWFCS